ncbi:hypothetical protein [Candidatus Marithrix sp. Canyon 246]|nr:hypothetical protein [Candidatus Marithrix sp. Canyon 246]
MVIVLTKLLRNFFIIPNLVARKLYVERLFEMHLTKSEREQTGKLAQ